LERCLTVARLRVIVVVSQVCELQQAGMPSCAPRWQFRLTVAVGRQEPRRADSLLRAFPVPLSLFHSSSYIALHGLFISYLSTTSAAFSCTTCYLLVGLYRPSAEEARHTHTHTLPPSQSFWLTACWCSRKNQVRLKNVKSHKAKKKFTTTRWFRQQVPHGPACLTVRNTKSIR
jgi:hypothetical protein